MVDADSIDTDCTESEFIGTLSDDVLVGGKLLEKGKTRYKNLEAAGLFLPSLHEKKKKKKKKKHISLFRFTPTLTMRAN